MASIQAIMSLALAALMIPASFYFASWMTGWARLARRHPGAPPLPGAVRNGGSLSMGSRLCNYNLIVRFASDDDHLHISLAPPFGLMSHPPISIPWAAVEFVEGGRRSLVLRRVELRVGAVRMWVPARVVEQETAVRREMAKAG